MKDKVFDFTSNISDNDNEYLKVANVIAKQLIAN